MTERFPEARCRACIQARGAALAADRRFGGTMRARPARLVTVGVFVALLAIAGFVTAGTLIPQKCTVDPRLVLCPAGDLTFHAIIRDGAANLVQNVSVELYLCNSTGWALCASGQPAEIHFFFSPCEPVALTGADGMATLALKAGGVTSDSTVLIRADGVPLAHRFLASPDQNGDLVVNSVDETIFAAKLGTHDLSADFDGDGVVTEADHAILRAHLGHACEMPTATRRSAWGEIKVRYR
jgi:hypothetical protein